ncbi:MAG TPA: arginine--tRNA ligase [Phycisphaerales bacterium]|nr:MAG: arginine--tRNA ligase [Planctomycetes bacterium GWC2_45_44]HBG78474.1 arginine--tRNA ligase [Phycisphaerales bacterium]HBR19969.1 arginine--tRNA ligase [Phycisphaerales bacterium]
MKNVIELISERITAAIEQATGQKAAAMVTPATDSKFGDYQSNGAFALAKQLKNNPRQLAEKVVAALQIDDICLPPEIAGAGFINLRLKPEFVAENLLRIAANPNLDIEKTSNPQTVVVDFSGPNIAKQMHVGHLRSTILGDCICNMLGFIGHDVKRQNHIGDWGKQFGMLCALYDRKCIEMGRQGKTLNASETLSDIEAFYREAQQLCNTDKEFDQEAREAIAGLHSGSQVWLARWEEIVSYSREHYEKIYEKLRVGLSDLHVRGESEYRDKLADVVNDLKQKKDSQGNPLAVESDGAICVFPDGFKTKEGNPMPFIIQKTDGAFLYATTDLAALRYRINELKADRIIYVTDARQKLHFEMLFAVARKAGWINDNIKLDHITFGSVLGEDGKPLKTRSGENVKLKDLLDEAVKRAKAVVEEKNPELSADEKEKIANAVGIGAVKYADYSNNRTSDYIFSFDKMLAMEGNTAPYMQYAYARVKSIGRKAEQKGINVENEINSVKTPNLTEPAELALAKHLIKYGQSINTALSDLRPNFLTNYLYELAQEFSGFYNACPVLEDTPARPTRLLLCDLTAKTIRHGLENLLGIEVVKQM